MFLQIFPENPVTERFRIKWDMLCAATGIPDKKPVGKFPVYQLSICLSCSSCRSLTASYATWSLGRSMVVIVGLKHSPSKYRSNPVIGIFPSSAVPFMVCKKAAAIRSFALITACGSSSPASYAAIIFLAYVSPERYS